MLHVPKFLTLDVPLARMAVHEWNAGQGGVPLLCVHGLTRNGHDFDYLARALPPSVRILCPDMPGRGQSPWLADPAGYNYPNYVAQALALIDALGITQVDWVGTSMGGLIAMMVASARPGLIRSLVLNDIGCVVAKEGMQRIATFADESSVFATRAEAEAAMRARWSTFGIKGEEQWRHMAEHGLQEADGKWRFAYDPAILAAYAKSRADAEQIADLALWHLWEPLKSIPILLIRGAQSDLLTHETAKQMRDTHPRLTLVEIPGVGHAPALMAPEQTALIRDWLAGLAT